MTQISYKHTAKEFCLEMKGHAGYAERGKDVVCSSLSTIFMILELACEEANSKDEIEALRDINHSGYALMLFTYRKADSRVRFVAELTINSLQILAAQFPENIEIKRRD